MGKYKGDPNDLVEFGSDDETGAPCVGALIRSLPEDKREDYRQARREFVARMCALRNLKPCTYRQYLLDEVEPLPSQEKTGCANPEEDK